MADIVLHDPKDEYTMSKCKEPIFEKTVISLKYLMGEFCFYIDKFHGYRIQNDITNPIKTPIEKAIRLNIINSINPCLVISNVSAEKLNTGIRIKNGLICYVYNIVPLYYINIIGTFEDYLCNNFKKKQRYNLKRSVKQFIKNSEKMFDFRCYKNSGEVVSFLNKAQEISKLTYQSKLLKAGLPNNVEFRKDLFKLAEQNRFYGYLLFRDEKPIAFAYCIRNGNTLKYNIIGYNPSYSKESPGNVLLMLILENVFREGVIDIFDFGPGYAQYKSIFSTNHLMVADVFLFQKSVKFFFKVAAHYSIDLFNSKTGNFLSKFGLKEQCRKWLRNIYGTI